MYLLLALLMAVMCKYSAVSQSSEQLCVTVKIMSLNKSIGFKDINWEPFLEPSFYHQGFLYLCKTVDWLSLTLQTNCEEGCSFLRKHIFVCHSRKLISITCSMHRRSGGLAFLGCCIDMLYCLGYILHLCIVLHTVSVATS